MNLENVCLDGCEAIVVPFLELNSILEILETVKRLFECSECTDYTDDCL